MIITALALLAAVSVVLLVGARHRPLPVRRTDPLDGGAGGSRPTSPHGGHAARPPPRRTRGHAQRVTRALPDALDLFVVTVEAGFSPVDALPLIAPIVDEPVRHAIFGVLERLDRSERWTDAVTALVDELGPAALGFVDALVQSERSGLGISPLLQRLADDARHHRRRLAESRARELPIQLSFPLVCCTLPAFVLIAIVPVLVGAWSSLRLR